MLIRTFTRITLIGASLWGLQHNKECAIARYTEGHCGVLPVCLSLTRQDHPVGLAEHGNLLSMCRKWSRLVQRNGLIKGWSSTAPGENLFRNIQDWIDHLLTAPSLSHLKCNPCQNPAAVINHKPSLMSAAQLARPCMFLSFLLPHTDMLINETAVAHRLEQLLDSSTIHHSVHASIVTAFS